MPGRLSRFSKQRSFGVALKDCHTRGFFDGDPWDWFQGALAPAIQVHRQNLSWLKCKEKAVDFHSHLPILRRLIEGCYPARHLFSRPSPWSYMKPQISIFNKEDKEAAIQETGRQILPVHP